MTGKKREFLLLGGLGKLTKSCPGKHDKRMPESIFNAICGQKPTKASDANLLNKCIFQVEKRKGIISFRWANVQLQTLVSFVLHTVCLYTGWVGHLPQSIRMLTSLHSAHSFWNDSIFLILFSFRVCGFEAI